VNPMADIFRYYKIGNALVKVKYNADGIKCAYEFDKAKKDFVINNLFISDIIEDADVKPLRREEFEKLVKIARIA